MAATNTMISMMRRILQQGKVLDWYFVRYYSIFCFVLFLEDQSPNLYQIVKKRCTCCQFQYEYRVMQKIRKASDNYLKKLAPEKFSSLSHRKEESHGVSGFTKERNEWSIIISNSCIRGMDKPGPRNQENIAQPSRSRRGSMQLATLKITRLKISVQYSKRCNCGEWMNEWRQSVRRKEFIAWKFYLFIYLSFHSVWYEWNSQTFKTYSIMSGESLL